MKNKEQIGFSRSGGHDSHRIALLMVATALGACGGGGGGGNDPAPPPPSTIPAPAPTPTPPPPPPPPPPTFALQGMVVAAAGTVIDGDVNDRSAPFQPNDTSLLAQPVPNPLTLGGYVNEPGTGEFGRSRLAGDPSDFYRVSLLAGQSITLSIANPASADLDLFLWDAAGNQIIDMSVGTGSAESLTAAESGDHLVEAVAFAGASNYVLTIGQNPQAGGALRLSTPMVEDEILLRPREPGSATALKGLGLASKARRAGPIEVWGLAGGDDRAEALARLGVRKDAARRAAVADEAARRRWDMLYAIKALRRRDDLELVEPNLKRFAMRVPNDEFYTRQWHYPTINLPQAWDITTGSEEVIVAVVDTGVLLSHPDFRERLAPGFDFVADPELAGDGDGRDPDPEDPGAGGPVDSNGFHGSHVAGTIGAGSNNGIGVAGVTWESQIMPLRALGVDGSGSSFDIIQAVRFAAGLDNESGTVPAQRADIINLSLGGAGFSQNEQNTYDEVRAQGIIVVAAAGNDASAVPQYPASYAGVVSVSAVDLNGNLAPYSSFGGFVDVAAPGGNSFADVDGDGFGDAVLSISGSDSSGSIVFGYRYLQGTSMAAPHIAGVAALMKAVDPDLTPPGFDNLLASGLITSDRGAPGRDDAFGHGIIDAFDAVAQAQGGAGAGSAVLSVVPGALNLGTLATSGLLAVTNGGGSTIKVGATATTEPWLSVTPPGSPDGLGEYLASVDRTGLSPATYSGEIEFLAAPGDAEPVGRVSVIMQVTNGTFASDAGFHYVLLIDEDTNEVIDQVAGAAQDGEYPYRFENLEAGRYQIIAGTDSNNDGFICDAGEACGGFLTLDQPTTVTLETDESGLDFGSGFEVTLQAQRAAQNAPGRRRARPQAPGQR